MRVTPNTEYSYKYKIYGYQNETYSLQKEENLGTFKPTTGKGELSISISGGKTNFNSQTGVLSIEEAPTLNVTPASAKDNISILIGFSYEDGGFWFEYDKTDMTFNLYERLKEIVSYHSNLQSIPGKSVKFEWYVKYSERMGFHNFYSESKSYTGSTYGLLDKVVIPENIFSE